MNADFLKTANAAIPFVVMGLIFYFMIYRPQKKQQKERAALLASIKEGSRVVTVGGIYGEVTKMHDEKVTLKIAEGVEIKVARVAIGTVQSQGADNK